MSRGSSDFGKVSSPTESFLKAVRLDANECGAIEATLIHNCEEECTRTNWPQAFYLLNGYGPYWYRLMRKRAFIVKL